MKADATTAFFARRRAASIGGSALLMACALAHPVKSTAAPDQATPEEVPATLKPDDSERAVFTWSATGSQIYECRVSEKGAFGWIFVAPEAELFDQNRAKAGTHGAGPFWAALDGSRTVGTVKAKADSARPSSIPLLLLSAKSAGTDGRMAGITSVQRLNTQGGNPPEKGCESPLDSSKRIKIGYTADYVFFAPK